MTATQQRPAAADTAALTVENMSIRFGDRVLVDDLSFTIGRGERVGLIGESGSGKSVTSLAVMGLLPETLTATGTVTVGADERNVVGLREKEAAGMRGLRAAMVFQEPMTALNPLMRIGQQIAEAMLIHGSQPDRKAARARVLELLTDVGLPNPHEAIDAYPHQLSGGQRQRVVLAIALANDPDLLVCDEPTTALDVTVQKQVIDLVLDVVERRGTGLLFITHDLAVVGETCDRILVMNQGELVEQGETEQIFTRPEHPYTRGLLAASDLAATDADGRLYTVATADSYEPGRNVDRMRASDPGAGRDPVVNAIGLTRTYKSPRTSLRAKPRQVEALKNVSFTINAGDRFGIVGESGSGKSTLLRLMSGLDQPTSGDVQVVGRSLVGASKRSLGELRRNLQIVFQDPMASLDPRMTIGDIVAEPLLNAANLQGGRPMTRREREDAVAEMIAAVGLPADSIHRFPHEFSGGQRQRVSIARALVCKPRILVADEPVSALDVSVRAQVLNLLADLVEEYRLTLIFVSHDLGVVRYLCDHVAVMRQGEIVEQGPTESIYQNPSNEYTRQLIDATPTIAHVLENR